MNKFFGAGLWAVGMLYAATAADTLPQLPGTPLKPVWKAESVATVENGVYRLAAIPQKAGVNYAGFKVPVTGSFKGQAISFSIKTAEQDVPAAFYVRAYNKDKKCIGSWKNWGARLSTSSTRFILIPGKNAGRLDWEPAMVKAADTEVAAMEFIFGQRNTVGKCYQLEVRDLCFISANSIPQETVKAPQAAQLPVQGFDDLGAPAQSAELRSSIGYMENGRHYLLTRPQDHGKTGYLLLTDLDSGKTEQYFNPENVRQRDNFGSVLTSKGIFMYDHGGHVVAFDTKTRKTTYLGKPEPTTSHFMVYTEAPDGTVYMGGTYTAALVSYNPKTGKFRNYGRMDPKEKYINLIATDKNGYVYCGIGSARANLVALNPKTGKVTQIIPENMRAVGWGNAWSGADGYAYMSFGKFSAKLLDGKVVETGVAMPRKAQLRPDKAAKYGGKHWTFPDGARVLKLSLDEKTIMYADQHGNRKVINMPYQSGGLHFTSMGKDGKGRIFASTSHPMHFVEYNTQTQKFTDHGPHPLVGGGNFCNIAYARDGKIYMCQYPAGRLWEFDPAKPYLTSLNKVTLPAGALTPADLLQIGNANSGKFSLLNNNAVLLCLGYNDGEKFTFPISVSTQGTYYLNVLAYEHSVYGKATFEFQGKTKSVNLQNITDRSSELHLGPFQLKPGTYTLTVSGKSNGSKSSKPMFGLNGILLSPDAPVKMLPAAGTVQENPRPLAAWVLEIKRPRAVQVHPDGKHVVISGFPEYGYCGGGIGIHNLETKKDTLIKDWLERHSCFTFRFADNGDIVGGTDISAPGGGHEVAAKPCIFRLDWKTKKVKAFTELAGAKQVASVELWNGKLYAAMQNGTLYVADPVTMKVQKEIPAGGFGSSTRNSLLKTEDNRLFILQSSAISEIHPVSGEKVLRSRAKYAVSSSGATESGYIYYASGPRVIRWQIPAKLK